jgi:site-specific recombinase XerC
MITAGNRPTTVNRRLDALRRLCRWAQATGTIAIDPARDIRRIRLPRKRQPLGLFDRTSAIACGANDWNDGRKGVFGP